MLSVHKSPNDKSGLGFNSINKNKCQDQVKNLTNIICFKCKVEGHHVRSCTLKKKHLSEKQQGKRPQGQDQVQPQVGERLLPKNIQANACLLYTSPSPR